MKKQYEEPQVEVIEIEGTIFLDDSTEVDFNDLLNK